MAFHELKQQQFIKRDIREVWKFFSSPKNLPIITPPYMNFRVMSELTDQVYPGQIITYKVSPVLSIPISWMTEITQVEEGETFY